MELIEVTPEDSIVPVYVEDLTLEERNLRKKELEDLQAEVQSNLDSRIEARESALAKLAALGLTEEEIAAL
jgi:type II secretory pathway predicted ATPase ExeA